MLVAATLPHGLPRGREPHVSGRFILLGLTDNQILRVLLGMVILCIYLLTTSGNLSTVILIRIFSAPPSYVFFLSLLAFVDMGYSSSVTPSMLGNFCVHVPSSWAQPFSWDRQVLPSGCHGLWWLHGNWQPAVSLSHSAHMRLCAVPHRGFCRQGSQCLLFFSWNLFFPLLWTTWRQSFFLWLCSFSWTLLFWYRSPRGWWTCGWQAAAVQAPLER